MGQIDRTGESNDPSTPPGRFVWRTGGWVTLTSYLVNDVFRFDGASYIVLENHTSGTFATDLSSGKLELMADKGLSGSGTGDMIGSNNLGEITDEAASRANIGAAKSGANTDITSVGDLDTGTLNVTEAVIFKEGAAVVSATTTEVWATDGNCRHVTGNNPISSFGTAPKAGATMRVIIDGTVTINDSANLLLNNGGRDVELNPGDWIDLYADTTTALRGVVHRLEPAASESDIREGSDDERFVTAGALRSAIGHSAHFQTDDITVTAAAGASIPHGIGRVPHLIQAFLVFQSAVSGYSTGDIIPIHLGYHGGTNQGVAVKVDATNITYRFGANATFAFNYMHATTGVTVNITNSTVKLRLVVWR